jgi:L-aspartate oxidase
MKTLMTMKDVFYHSCDVLVVGSGLAGFRAGISALSKSKNRCVYMVTGGKGASGSSFTNRNNGLGMVVCHTENEKDSFCDSALRIASPGIIKPELVRIMADHSDYFFNDLCQTGFQFKKRDEGGYLRFQACFMKTPDLAYVFTGLETAFISLKNRFLNHGGQICEGFQLIELLKDDTGRMTGAMFIDDSHKRILAVHAGAIVMATGGTAGLFMRNIAGRGVTGLGSGLMKKMGAAFINTGYLQFLWYETETLEHWPCWSIISPEIMIKDRDGQTVVIPDSIRKLGVERSQHIPLCHGGDDSDIDEFLLSTCNADGTLDIYYSDKSRKKVALFAHASNGGALIDDHAATTVKGLFACGECAGGMHGANRVGGAMVLATQVFGHRAGVFASQYAGAMVKENKRLFESRVQVHVNSWCIDQDQWRSGLAMIKEDLGCLAGPHPRKGGDALDLKYREVLETATDLRLNAAIESVLLIVGKST